MNNFSNASGIQRIPESQSTADIKCDSITPMLHPIAWPSRPRERSASQIATVPGSMNLRSLLQLRQKQDSKRRKDGQLEGSELEAGLSSAALPTEGDLPQAQSQKVESASNQDRQWA